MNFDNDFNQDELLFSSQEEAERYVPFISPRRGKVNSDEYWVQADGQPIRYSDMGEQHLEKSVAMVRRNLKATDDAIVAKAMTLVEEVVQPESFWVEFHRLQTQQDGQVKNLARLLGETRRREDAQSQENVERARLKWMRGEGENPELPGSEA